MTNAWSSPQDWSGFVNAAQMNTYVRDNFTWLKTRPSNQTSVTTVTTTSTSFVKLTGSDTAVTSVGGNMLIFANGKASISTPAVVTFDLAIDGTRQGDATNGLTVITTPTANYNDCVDIVFFTSTPPNAASHTYSVYWKVSTGTGSCLLRVYAIEIR